MIIVPQHRSLPTSRSRALTERLRTTIAEFQHREPKVTEEEVAQALRDAMPGRPTPRNVAPAAVLAVIAGALTAIGVGLFASNASNAGRPVPAAPLIAIAIAGFGVMAALIARSRGDR